MEKLNLPIIKTLNRKKKFLSMDDYLKFVIFNLKYAFAKKNKNFSKAQVTTVPFLLKG